MSNYFDKNQTSDLRQEEIKVKINNKEIKLLSASGIFSKTKLDTGTKCLLENYEIGKAKKVLDLGCGYGIVAITICREHNVEMFACDSNQRAVDYTIKNCKKNKVDVKVFLSDLFSKLNETFDLILTNPPYVAGRETCFKFITESFEHLNKDGELQLVARHQKGGKMLELKMQEVFGNVDVLGKQSGFRVYRSKKK
ncbi:MAG: class I SAM-dependent methyltransferase [Candidatus Woesearchaeota archaeon]